MDVKAKKLIKINSIVAATVIVISFAILISASNVKKGMISIIMAKDSASFVGGVVNQEIVQKMVNASIVELTMVIDDISFAYECLFPYGTITDSTKIVIKYNPKTCPTTRKPMCEALKNGLTYMLDYSFPAHNITIVGDGGDACMKDTIVIDSAGQNLKYTIKDIYSNADCIIYCPSAWGTDIGCGVDMNLSLMLSSIEGVDTTTVEAMYPLFHDTTSPSLSLLNYHPTFNGDYEKVVLYMMDLLSYSGTGDSADLQPGYKIYTCDNITVTDWKGIRFLRDTVGAIDSLQEWQALKVCSLSVVPYVDLGVVNEGQMLEIAIRPPWTFFPPGAPTLVSPVSGTTGLETDPTFEWNTSSGAESYSLRVSKFSDFSSLIVNQNNITETSYKVSGLKANTQYFWRVRATNKEGGASAWSSVWTFMTKLDVPAAPTLSLPANGTVDVETDPTLLWNTTAGAALYSLQVATSSDFSSLIVNQSNIANTYYNVSGLLNNTQYFWRVNASNIIGTSAWSGVWNFTVTATDILEDSSVSTQKPYTITIFPDKISYTLKSSGNVSITVFDIYGRLIETFIDSYKQAGKHTINWDSKRFGAGIYYIRLKANGSSISKKLTIIK